MYASPAIRAGSVWETLLVPKPEGRDPSRVARGTHASLDCQRPEKRTGRSTAGWWNLDVYKLPTTGRRLYCAGWESLSGFVLSLRRRHNLYTNSRVVMDARSGPNNHFPRSHGAIGTIGRFQRPPLIRTGGKQLLVFTPKNGYLYGLDLATASSLSQRWDP